MLYLQYKLAPRNNVQLNEIKKVEINCYYNCLLPHCPHFNFKYTNRKKSLKCLNLASSFFLLLQKYYVIRRFPATTTD